MASDTRTRMLETTARLLQHRGYFGTALSDILAASGAPRGSLYFHFPGGKDQLVIEATRLAVEETSAFLRETLAAARGPAEGVRLFFEAAADLLVETDYSFGCPVAPVILDAPDALPELRAICRQAFEEWTRALPRAASSARACPTARAAALAVLIEAAMEGLLADRARLSRRRGDAPGRGRARGASSPSGAGRRRRCGDGQGHRDREATDELLALQVGARDLGLGRPGRRRAPPGRNGTGCATSRPATT